MGQPYKNDVSDVLDLIDPAGLNACLIGVEKESLRADAAGALARTPHPSALGSALTNPHITTDFSEALLEFVTPASADYWKVHQYLCDLHTFTYKGLGDELLWVTSMPCLIGAESDIPLAQYGTSNVGKMKTAYRHGLGLRYGRPMQTIAGLHFNFSLPDSVWHALHAAQAPEQPFRDFKSARYLGLVRNFRRIGWLILYLFGASPAVCKSFIDDPYSALPEFDQDTLFEPYATSLRMSDLGYSNKNQSRLQISLNSLDDYVRDLTAAITQVEPEYEALGVKVAGHYRQLNANTLQIENEYYSPMRPKRVAESGERPTAALARGGIEYVELRSLDLNPFEPVGISQRQADFVKLLLLSCAFRDSDPLDAQALTRIASNDAMTARSGRAPGLTLDRDGEQILLTDWAQEIVRDTQRIADAMSAEVRERYQASVSHFARAVIAPERLPSAEMLELMSTNSMSFFEFARSSSAATRDYFLGLEPINELRQNALADAAAQSLQRQAEIEAADDISFDAYLENYFSAA